MLIKAKKHTKKEFCKLYLKAKRAKEYLESNWKYYKANAINKLPERACCKHARVSYCVCERSYVCPVHGDCHIGSHD